MEKLIEKYPHLAKVFSEAQERQSELFARKMLDYGINNLKAGTQLQSDSDIRFALLGIWFRMMDKMNRWSNMQRADSAPNCENLVDTFEDLANYAIIAKLILNKEWHEG